MEKFLFQNEILKPISRNPNYFISNFGRVWSNYSNKWLKPTIATKGNYSRCYVSLGRGNKVYVHRLVAENFIDNPYNLPEIDHIDANGLNNKVENLRWVNHQQNMENENTKETIKKNTGYLLEIEEIETGKIFYGVEAVSKYFNVCKGTVNNHLNNKVKNPKWRTTGKRINPNKVSPA